VGRRCRSWSSRSDATVLDDYALATRTRTKTSKLVLEDHRRRGLCARIIALVIRVRCNKCKRRCSHEIRGWPVITTALGGDQPGLVATHRSWTVDGMLDAATAPAALSQLMFCYACTVPVWSKCFDKPSTAVSSVPLHREPASQLAASAHHLFLPPVRPG